MNPVKNVNDTSGKVSGERGLLSPSATQECFTWPQKSAKDLGIQVWSLTANIIPSCLNPSCFYLNTAAKVECKFNVSIILKVYLPRWNFTWSDNTLSFLIKFYQLVSFTLSLTGNTMIYTFSAFTLFLLWISKYEKENESYSESWWARG